MPSKFGNSVSSEIGKLLDLLNASEQLDDLTEGDFAVGADNTQEIVDPQAVVAEQAQQKRQTSETIRPAEEIPSARNQSQPITFRQTPKPKPVVENAENRFAAHIVHGMWKIKKD